MRVFEFNTETYYKQTMQPFNSDIVLDGLEAAYQQTFSFKDLPPNFKYKEDFSIPQLTGKVGLFIVEFVGNGVRARAVIKKGSLSFVHRSTIYGHLGFILDDAKQVCKGERTGVMFGGEFFSASATDGHIVIPYGKQLKSSKIIMIHGTFAQLGDFACGQENYEFRANFFLERESVLLGASTTLVVRPALFINRREADLKHIKNVKLTVTIGNYIDDTQSTKVFD